MTARRRWTPAVARAIVLALAVVLVLPALAEAGPFGRKGPYRKGQVVSVTGQVIGPNGQAVGNVTVLLTISRNAFRITKMSRVTGAPLQVPGTAGDDGRFRIDWSWDPYYNTFELTVALPVRKNGHDTYEEFHRVEVTGNVLQSNPSDVGLVVPDTRALEELRAFLDSLKSDDEKRVYHEMGRPDRVDTGKAHYDPDRSWWYFEAGKVYRFSDGALDQVVRFDPVSSEP